jgi:SAM-dependent methyltransferase
MTLRIALDDDDAQARAGWRIGAALCRDCGGYHQIWGLLRAAGVVGGPRVDQGLLPSLLNELSVGGARILIAGSADAGLLQVVAGAVAARPLTVTVADRCPAPLALIGEIETPTGVTVGRLRADLTRLDQQRAYDLILSHSMLYFVPRKDQQRVLEQLRDALDEDGRLVLVLRLSAPVDTQGMAAHDDAWLTRAHAKLAARPDLIALAGDDLGPVLQSYANARAVRLYAFTTAQEVETVLNSAGFALDRHLVSGQSTTMRLGDAVNAKQSHIFVARRA